MNMMSIDEWWLEQNSGIHGIFRTPQRLHGRVQDSLLGKIQYTKFSLRHVKWKCHWKCYWPWGKCYSFWKMLKFPRTSKMFWTWGHVNIPRSIQKPQGFNRRFSCNPRSRWSSIMQHSVAAGCKITASNRSTGIIIDIYIYIDNHKSWSIW